MKICYIFAAAEGLPEDFKKKDGDLVIAADAGIRHLAHLGAEPDIALGDFDSLGFEPRCREVIRHPVMKNDTDTVLAVKTGFSRGYSEFVIYGGTGGRPDHTFANYQTLSYIALRGGRGFLCFNGFTASAIRNSSVFFSEKAAGTLSVFALSERISGVYLKNVLYPLENAELSYDFPLGVSNEFVGRRAEVRVENGTALLIWQGNRELLG